MCRPSSIFARTAAACLAAGLAMPAAADPWQHGWTLGVEAMALERSYSVGGIEVSGDAALAGVQLSLQRSLRFRAEGRLLAGGMVSEVGGDGGSSDPAGFAEGEVTWGLPLPDGARLYGGLGARSLRADFSDGGEETSVSLYLPLGISKSGSLHGGWRAETALEGQIVLGKRHEIELPSGDNGEFDAFGGWGAELAARFTHPDTPVQIEPYLRHVATADSRSADFGGTDGRVEDLAHSALGLRLGARF